MSLKDFRGELAYRDDYETRGGQVYLDELHKLYCERSGSGPPLLLVPGLAGDLAELSSLRDALEDSFTVIGYDRRGYSRSARGWSRSTLDEQANDLARLLTAVGVQDAVVVSGSVGACIVLKVLQRFPGRVRGAILHEPWIPALLPERGAVEDRLTAGTRWVSTRRARWNVGPFEARLRFLLGRAAFESLHAEVRARVSKNREMFTVEDTYFSTWLPPARELFTARPLQNTVITVGTQSHSFVQAMASRLGGRLGLPVRPVPGMHAAYIDCAEEFAAVARPLLQSWAEGGGG